jgi:hypothetical protein
VVDVEPRTFAERVVSVRNTREPPAAGSRRTDNDIEGRRGGVMRRAAISIGIVLVVASATPAWACGGLVNPNGTVSLVRTTTLAGYRDGVEHYVTSFEFAGGGAEFGSIVPLPGIPSKVQRAGDWTLQRLVREVQPPVEIFAAAAIADQAVKRSAAVLLETRIDALDITILKGGGDAVGRWAKEHGYVLTPDAPEVLDFYAERSPIFMAARFDPEAAAARGQRLGDGTPIHLAIPTPNPWVPLRILGLGLGQVTPVEADVFLLTEAAPEILPRPEPAGSRDGITLERSERASRDLLGDLRADKGMGWIPPADMWFSYLRVKTTAGQLNHDLAVDATGAGEPSPVAAGIVGESLALPEPTGGAALRSWALGAALIAVAMWLVGLAVWASR